VPVTSYLRNGDRSQLTDPVAGALKPGHGLPKLHVGMNREQCRNLFGDPDQVRSFKDGTFFQYLEQGFDIDFELGSRAERLFYYRAGVQKHRGQCAVTISGIGFRSTAGEIEKALGPASRTGTVGRKQWVLYDSGIQFDLDARGRVEVIVVFRAST